jgi:tetrahydromethanopterin S-methyltransferase subunit H
LAKANGEKMFRFAKEQLVANLAGVKVGGQPGEFPTALCGTIFYQGQRMVSDHEKGIFDAACAEDLVRTQAELSDQTGCPAILHIYARTIGAFQRYLDFADRIWNGPIIADSSDPSTRAAISMLVSEIGIADKVIYNSLNLGSTPEEEDAVKDSEVDSAILLAYNPGDQSVEGRMKILESGRPGKRGLIPMAKDLGIKNVLIDPGVTPMGSGAGSSLRFAVVAKAKLGLPVGSGMHNAPSSWDWLRSRSIEDKRCCDAAALGMQILAASDFALYGPIECAGFIFPAAAMADIMVSEAVRDLEIWPEAGHPANRLV